MCRVRLLVIVIFLLLMSVNSVYAVITVSSTEVWDGGQVHGITPSGSGTLADPYVYVIPDGMNVTSSGVIEMNDKYVTFDFSSGSGGLDIAAGGYFDLTGITRRSDPGVCTIILGDNSITGDGDFKTVNVYKDSMDVQIFGTSDISVNSFYMRVHDAFVGSLVIDIGGSADIGLVDTHDQAGGGNNGGDVTIQCGDLSLSGSAKLCGEFPV
jgi:hypothetical protein